MSAGFLDEMARGSRERLRAAQRVRSHSSLEGALRQLPPAPRLQLHASGFDLIAELKLRSPAQGQLQGAHEDLAARVAAYAAGGAAAVSVLTEPERFDGTLAHLEGAARVLRALKVPAMRKDFLVDPYQVLEARVAGAGGVLVILRMLPRGATEALIECARELDLFVLLEAFDEADIELMEELIGAAPQDAQLLAGLNCRDLATLQVVPQRLLQLAARLPQGVPRVAESGVTTAAEAAAVARAGYQLILVGSALMQGADPATLAAKLLAGGRAALGR
jgi:indole-3-glycerol phosphate synthase